MGRPSKVQRQCIPLFNDMPDQLTVREVTPAPWDDFRRLFERRGGPKHCWCMVWRSTPEEARKTDGASRKAFMARRV